MRKLVALLLFLGACKTTTPTPAPAGPSAGTTGTTTSEAAVTSFLGAVKAGDLQAMSLVWGTEKGPASAQMDRAELEKREIIMQCFFNHDQARIVSRLPSESTSEVYVVELKKGTLTRTPKMTTVRGPQGRWYLSDAEIDAVRDFCRNPPGTH